MQWGMDRSVWFWKPVLATAEREGITASLPFTIILEKRTDCFERGKLKTQEKKKLQFPKSSYAFSSF